MASSPPAKLLAAVPAIESGERAGTIACDGGGTGGVAAHRGHPSSYFLRRYLEA